MDKNLQKRTLCKAEIIELIEVVSNRMIEAKTKEIEAKYLSKDEIKELITDECSKNSCKNARDSNESELIRPKVGD